MVTLLEAVAQSVVSVAAIILVEESLRTVTTRTLKRAGAGRTVVGDIGGAFRAMALITIGFVVLGITGLASEFTALTFSGIAALAASLALQSALSNIIAGILLFHDGAIHLNDEVEYGGVKGKVARVALRNTWIKTDAGTIVIVSNSSLSSGPLTNHSATERLSKKYAI